MFGIGKADNIGTKRSILQQGMDLAKRKVAQSRGSVWVPIIMIAKYDAIAPDVKQKIMDGDFVKAAEVLEHYLQQSKAIAIGSKLNKVSFDDVYSGAVSIKTVFDENGRVSPALNSDNEIEFSVEAYQEFIDRLGKLPSGKKDLSVSVLAARGGGKTTFLSLLWLAAEMRESTSSNIFRAIVDPETQEYLGGAIRDLKVGRFAAATPMGSTEVHEMTFGYNRTLPNKLGLENYRNVKINACDVSGEDLKTLNSFKDGDKLDLNLLPENLKTVLSSDVIVFLVDATVLTNESRSPKFTKLATYDKDTSVILAVVSKFRNQME